VWACGDYERVSERLAPIHDGLVARLAPTTGERWLDVGTGTGAVALRAARAGADVVGVDITPELLDQARASADRLPVRFEVGDAQELRYDDASFDVVTSVFGAIFAPDQEAVGRELARVCRLGGRLGLTAWHASKELDAAYEQAGVELDVLGADPLLWSDDAHVRRLLGGAFDLVLEPGVWQIEFESPDRMWQWWSTFVPPFVALLDRLPPERAHALRDAFVEVGERSRVDGGVELRRDYVLVLGTRR
jgi:SAM-dependent methyltransferase